MILLMKISDFNSWIFVILLFTYTLVYRTYIDGLRLVSKGIINKADIWKMVYKGRRSEYMKALYFK